VQRRVLMAGAAVLVAPRMVRAQRYPVRPVRLVVTWPPGGSADILARQMQAPLSAALGQPVVIDNRSGASGAIGAAEVIRAPADGCTFGMVTSTLVSMALLQRQSYDPVRDVTPILQHSRVANILVVHPSLPVRTVPELIAHARERQGGLSFGSPGIGSAVHISGEMFRLATATNLVHVPYRGGGPALADLVSGSLQLMFGNASSTLPYVRDGSLRAIAVTSAQRVPYLPDVPTIAESGLPGFAIDEWYGCIGPRGMPAATVEQLNAAISAILSAPAERARLLAMGAEVAVGTPEAFGRLITEDMEKIGRVVRDARVTLE
jgi:tripartite-type tricarboxylate transporter receptor subunit TctC